MTTLPLLKNLIGVPLVYDHPGIYQIILVGTELSYVGRSLSVGGRLLQHANALVVGKHYNHKLQDAWNEHGADRFVFKLLEEVREEDIVTAEQKWIDHFKAATIGFNIMELAGSRRELGLRPLHPSAVDEMLFYLQDDKDLKNDEGRARIDWFTMFGLRSLVEKTAIFVTDPKAQAWWSETGGHLKAEDKARSGRFANGDAEYLTQNLTTDELRLWCAMIIASAITLNNLHTQRET